MRVLCDIKHPVSLICRWIYLFLVCRLAPVAWLVGREILGVEALLYELRFMSVCKTVNTRKISPVYLYS
jgi:hypothetical protein